MHERHLLVIRDSCFNNFKASISCAVREKKGRALAIEEPSGGNGEILSSGEGKGVRP